MNALILLLLVQEDPALPKVPADWKVEVVARFPDVRHPTVVACSPDGRVFVGEDPQDMEGPVDRPIGRVVCIHPGGKVTVFAEGLGVVFGLQYLDGKVYVHHCPKLTAYRDENGVGKDPHDLLACTHPEPWKINRYNTHIPAGFKLAMDGFFYMAVGDKGIFGAVGRDGARMDMRGGGVLRFRPDATGLEVFSTGTRNFTDVAIDAEDGIFAWDNDDNVRWGARVLHLVEGGYYGYPWDFQRPFALGAIGDGRGIPAGGVAYEEDALPAEYRGNLFFCEWGRSQIVRFRLSPQGATKRIVSKEPIFSRGGDEFRPVGIAVAPGGEGFYVADWNTARRLVKHEAGRVLKFTYSGRSQAAPRPAWSGAESTEALIAALDHPALSVRMTAQRRLADGRAVEALASTLADPRRPVRARIHALWALDGGPAVLAAARDADPALRRQALRHLGTRRVKEARDVFVAALRDPDGAIRLQAATALGRLAEEKSVPALQAALADPDPGVRHAVFTALRRTGAWRAIGEGLWSDSPAVREGTLFALRECFETPVVSLLAAAARDGKLDGRTRAAALETLAELHRKDPPWDGSWWGTRPALNPRPARTLDYEGTPLVFAALRESLGDSQAAVRRAAIDGLRATGDKTAIGPLRARLAKEKELRLPLLVALESLGDPDLPITAEEILAGEVDVPLMVLAARMTKGPETLSKALRRDLPAEVLSSLLDAVGDASPAPAVVARLSHSDAEVASRAARALGRMGSATVAGPLRSVLGDPRIDVRRAAAESLGILKAREAAGDLLKLRSDPECRLNAISALAAMPDLRAVEAYLEGIGEKNPEVRSACRRALQELGDAVLSEIDRRASSLPDGVVAELQRLYADRSSSAIHRRVVKKLEPPAYEEFATSNAGDPVRGKTLFADAKILACGRCHVIGGQGGDIGPDLSIAGAIYGRAYLVESILHPSRIVAGGYRQAMVQTKSGAIYVGLAKRETPTELVLQDGDGKFLPLRKDDIAARKSSTVSIMPEGLVGGLSLQEFADLIAYLETLKAQE